jgi:hypothetical protein
MKRRPFYPFISSLGVKKAVNNVNITKPPPYFQSRREITSIFGGVGISFVKIRKTPRRDLGVSMLTNLLVNKSQKIS